MPEAISAASAPAPAATAPAPAASAAGSAFSTDMFLKLLVAQLRYQNPMEPADTTGMMQQSAQFSMVETMQNMLTTVGTQAAWQQAGLAQGMIGSTVEVTDTYGKSVTGVVRGYTSTTDGPLLQVETDSGTYDYHLNTVNSVRE